MQVFILTGITALIMKAFQVVGMTERTYVSVQMFLNVFFQCFLLLLLLYFDQYANIPAELSSLRNKTFNKCILVQCQHSPFVIFFVCTPDNQGNTSVIENVRKRERDP